MRQAAIVLVVELAALSLSGCDAASTASPAASAAPTTTAPDYDHWTVDFGALVDQADSVEVTPVGSATHAPRSSMIPPR